MATLDDKLLGEKLHYYCSSSESEREDDDDDGDKLCEVTSSGKEQESAKAAPWGGSSCNVQ